MKYYKDVYNASEVNTTSYSETFTVPVWNVYIMYVAYIVSYVYL